MLRLTVYITDLYDNTVSIIDGKTNNVTKTVTVGKYPNGVSINPNTNLVYVTNSGDDTVSVIDGKTNTVLKGVIQLGIVPYNVAVNPNTNLIYVN